MTICELCGASPAARIKLKRGVGLVLVQTVYKADLFLCSPCAKKATSSFQRETLKKGWTSPRSAIMNPFYLAGNAIRQAKHERELDESDPGLRNNSFQSNDMAAQQSPQLSSNGVHPVDLLAAFTPADETQRSLFTALLLDFTGGGITSSKESVEAATRVPSREQAEEMLEIATSLVEASQVSGGLGSGLPHAIFVTAMEDWTGISLSDFSPVQKAIATAVSDAAFQLSSARRLDEALGASMIACVLFTNSISWQQFQN